MKKPTCIVESVTVSIDISTLLKDLELDWNPGVVAPQNGEWFTSTDGVDAPTIEFVLNRV